MVSLFVDLRLWKSWRGVGIFNGSRDHVWRDASTTYGARLNGTFDPNLTTNSPPRHSIKFNEIMGLCWNPCVYGLLTMFRSRICRRRQPVFHHVLRWARWRGRRRFHARRRQPNHSRWEEGSRSSYSVNMSHVIIARSRSRPRIAPCDCSADIVSPEHR